MMWVYLFGCACVLAGWTCCALLCGDLPLDEELAVLLMDKQAAQDAARVKDLELQRVRS